jgi:CheY-like chemotaxis protein
MARILVVDDETAMIDHMTSIAGGPGRDVEAAENADEAIRKITEQDFDVVVTDLHMRTDVEAGFRVLRAAKEKNIYTRVIVCTAVGTKATSAQAMLSGAFDYLERGIAGTDHWEMLKKKIDLALEFRSAKQSASYGQIRFDKTVSDLHLTIEEELKKALRQVVFEAGRERSAILGLPRQADDWPEVFVLMPFSSKLKPIYENHIKPTVSELMLRIGRADDFFFAGPIMKDIWSAIHAARIIVADCTGRNPNVFYEIGLAHAIGRDTILIAQSIDDVPFDLRHLRIIVYEYTPPGMDAFENALRAAIAQTVNITPPQARSGNASAS